MRRLPATTCFVYLKPTLDRAVCAHGCGLLVSPGYDCIRYTNSSCKMNTLTHMADYISVVQVQDGVWPEVQIEDVHVVSRSQTLTLTHSLIRKYPMYGTC